MRCVAETASVVTILLAAWGEPPPTQRPAERHEERLAMVERQIAEPSDGREPVTDPKVLEAMRAVPRHRFVPPEAAQYAYRDHALSIGHGQTISQPYIVAYMTELAGLDATSRVLEIGTGSGYQTAVLARITPHVYSIEIVEPLHQRARKVLAELGIDTVQLRLGDGYKGWPEAAPFDAILVTCAPDELPEPLWEQLAPGGRIVVPLGEPDEIQRLVVITKAPDGTRQTRTVMPVRFVPMTGPQP